MNQSEYNTHASKHQIALTIRYLGPTNTKGSRVKMSLPRWDNKGKTISYDHRFRDTLEIACNWLKENNVDYTSFLDMGDFYVIGLDWDYSEQIRKLFNIA